MREASVLDLERQDIKVIKADFKDRRILVRTSVGEQVILTENRQEIINLAEDHPLPALIVSLLPPEE